MPPLKTKSLHPPGAASTRSTPSSSRTPSHASSSAGPSNPSRQSKLLTRRLDDNDDSEDDDDDYDEPLKTSSLAGRQSVVQSRLSLDFGVDGDDRIYSTKAVQFDVANSLSPDTDDDDHAMADPSTAFLHSSRSGTPLLKGEDDRGRARYNHSRPTSPLPATTASGPARPTFSRTSTMRSRSPDTQARTAARKKYTYAAFFLVTTLVAFVIQTELAAYVQSELGWNKAYCMMYVTHSSWSLLWPVQLVALRIQKWRMPWRTFWRRHVSVLRSTAHMAEQQDLDVPRHLAQTTPVRYFVRTTALITSALTVAGISWYLAVDMTSPSDLTAIYNCSAFFAYAFSVPLLKERLRLGKSVAVLIAIVGVFVVAYGDSKETTSSGGGDADGGDSESPSSGGSRLLGNMIIGAGSVLYGLYEVLYKRLACPPEGVSPQRGMIFATTVGSCIGLFTMLVLWLPLPFLHWLGWETFEMPTGNTALWLWISVAMNATFAGSFLVLISLTSPVLSSVAALLTIFIVAITDWLVKGEALSLAALFGGVLIVVAFLMLSWSTWREMTEDAQHKAGLENGPVDYWTSDDEEERSDGGDDNDADKHGRLD